MNVRRHFRRPVNWLGEGVRKTRRKWHGPGRFQTLRLWLAFGGWRDVWVFTLTALVLVSLYRLQVEAQQRRDQSCTIQEKKQLADVTQLKQTYKFLLDPASKKSGLYKVVLISLPRAESEAREDDAPAFCDEPDVGLPEPDSKIPPRPASIKLPKPPPPPPPPKKYPVTRSQTDRP